jgi:hypothetical protein
MLASFYSYDYIHSTMELSLIVSKFYNESVKALQLEMQADIMHAMATLAR